MMHDMVQSFFEGDIVKSRELQFKLNPLVKALFSEVNPIPVKMATQYDRHQRGPSASSSHRDERG